MCYNFNFFVYVLDTVSDPDNILQWTVNELLESEAIGEDVYIIGHVPPGDLDCLENWSHIFHQVVERFSSGTIKGLFYGHTHADEFEIFYRNSDFNQPPIQVAYM
jgi:sphingomyelin phosphodiesterase